MKLRRRAGAWAFDQVGRPRAQLFFFALGMAAAACADGKGQLARTPRRVPLIAGASVAAPYSSPARFRYHPRERGRSRAERVLSDGRRLFVGERGERWLFDPRDKSLSPGAVLAPEPLVQVLIDADTFWFVGASGTSYAARDPLGRFERSSAPVEALNGVSAAGSAIVGVRQSRTLLRSGDYGLTWTAVGPEGVALVDVALSPSGRGLALSVPEALYATEDAGATFRRLDVPAVAALELETREDGELLALSPLGDHDFRWNPPGWSPSNVGVRASSPKELGAPPRGPDASAIAEGRATFSGAIYLELSPIPNRPQSYELLSGRPDGKLSAAPVRAAEGCRAVRLAAFERFVAFACFRASIEAATQRIELFQSTSFGASFERVGDRLDGSLATFRLAVGAKGRWIATGVCPPGAPAAGCSPSGVQRQREPGEPFKAPQGSAKGGPRPAGVLSATPSLAEVAQALGFSSDGNAAYAVGRRTKTGRFALFVSRDAGKSFEPEDLDLGQVASDDSGDEVVERSPGTRVESLSAAEDGAVSITFAHYGRRTLVVTDDRGKLLSSAEAPEERALLSGSGLRALAIAQKSRQVWESLDGGVTWSATSVLPIELCPGADTCDVPLRCAPSACVIGRELSRVGWGGQTGDEAEVLPPPLRPMKPTPDRRVRTPIVCTLDAAPFAALPGVSDAPGAHDSAIGNVAWFAVGEDPNRASASVFVAKKGRVEHTALFEPSQRPETQAYRVIGQVEGVAALRYRIPEAEPRRTSITDVEVVWNNFFEGRLVRARLADGGPYRPGDYVTSGARAQRAEPHLLSIAAGGVYLRLHQAARTDQPTLFLDGRSVETLPAVEWARDPRFPAREEMVRVGGAHVPILFVGRGAALVRAQRAKTGAKTGAFEFDGFASGMIDPAGFGLVELDNIAYVGSRAGLYVEIQDGTGGISSGQVFPIRADGPLTDPPVPTPTQRSLGERPETCEAERRAKTPRVVAAFAPGTRHPVIVSDAVEAPRTLLTGFSVLYGSKEAPCAAALEAIGVPGDASQTNRDSALVLLDDLEHSVLFRTVGDRNNPRIEYRHMACRFDPAAEIPPEVYRATGVVGR